MKTHLLWDIDGTLLTTARAGIFAWERAVEQVLGREADLSELQTAGLTDFQIAELIAARFGGRTEAAGALLRAYAEALPERLGRRRGSVLTNVRENLSALAERSDVVNLLLTGNVEHGAVAKLRHYGLAGFFPHGGAFCVEGSDRESIARAARELIGDGYRPERAFVIGDTPHDIACGRAIGARTIAVASGPGYGRRDLEEAGAWVALDELPEPSAFLSLLGLPGPPGQAPGHTLGPS